MNAPTRIKNRLTDVNRDAFGYQFAFISQIIIEFFLGSTPLKQ